MIVRPGFRLATAAILAALVPAAPVFAQQADEGDAPARAGHLTGEVQSIDYRGSRFVVRSRGAHPVTVDADPSTSVIVPNEPGYHGITDLRSGDRVRVDTSDHGRRRQAQVIEILSH